MATQGVSAASSALEAGGHPTDSETGSTSGPYLGDGGVLRSRRVAPLPRTVARIKDAMLIPAARLKESP
jgi:hypothetical protein